MTYPLTPREKVARAALWAEMNHSPGVWDTEPKEWSVEALETHGYFAIADAILTALASGSGDHAELARLAEAAEHDPEYDGRSFEAAANPATVLVLLAEIAALREREKTALKECGEWARQAGEAIGKLETSEAAGIVEGWRDRATEAERKLAEAVGHISWMRHFVPTVWASTEERLNEIDTFLSKEAERG